MAPTIVEAQAVDTRAERKLMPPLCQPRHASLSNAAGWPHLSVMVLLYFYLYEAFFMSPQPTRIWVFFFASTTLMVGLVDSTTATRRIETPFLPLSRSRNCHDSYGRLQSDYPQSGTCLTVASITVFMLRRLCESQAMF